MRIYYALRKYNLSAREIDVFLLANKGKSILEMRKELDLSENTICQHTKSIHKKMGLKTRMQMIFSKEDLAHNGSEFEINLASRIESLDHSQDRPQSPS